jgi:hypothetical protein
LPVPFLEQLGYPKSFNHQLRLFGRAKYIANNSNEQIYKNEISDKYEKYCKEFDV